MQILICSATKLEIAPLLQSGLTAKSAHEVDFTILGVGIMSATYNLLERIHSGAPDLVLLAGIGGTFDNRLDPGDVVQVVSDMVADLGVSENDDWRDLFDLNLIEEDGSPYTSRQLINPNSWPELVLPSANGITVNQVTSSPEVVTRWRTKYNCDVESMEGAAVHYVCLKKQVPFIHVRAISNSVGERNKTKWDIANAVKNLNVEVERIIEKL